MTDWHGLPFDDDEPLPPAAARPLTVSEVTAGIRDLLEHAFASLAVEG